MRLLPVGAEPDAAKLVVARSLRGLADGMVSVVLASYLSHLGFSAGQIGVLITGTLLGSAALTLGVGLFGQRFQPRTILLGASCLMLVTGVGFLGVTSYWPLLLIAVAGTLNPTSGDVSVFLPTEQTLLTRTVTATSRTALFSRYSLAGAFGAAIGALVSGVPVAIARREGWDLLDAERVAFIIYGVIAVAVALTYARLRTTAPQPTKAGPLATSRRIVLGLAALFSIDSFGGGFLVQSLLALWLFNRFGLSLETAGAVFFAAGVLTSISQLASPWLAERIGLVRTMAFTHLPSNIFLILAAFMPSAPLAITFLLLRMALAQMDVPARQSYVMAMVPAEERTAAASVTGVSRSLASALAPALSGALLSATTFGWPLVIAGILKSIYDLLLLAQFRNQRPAEELARSPS